MKTIYILILVILVALGSGYPMNASGSNAKMTLLIKDLGDSEIDHETEQFLQVKAFVFDREWEKVKNGLERYLEKYPSGKYRDEALYWLAQSLNKLSTDMKSLNALMENKEHAFDKLNHLIEQYPESLWIDDAKTLRMELAGDLALLGNAKQIKMVQTYAKVENTNLDKLKLIGSNHLTNLEEVTAISVLKKIIKQEKNLDIRRKVILQIGWYYPEAASDLLQDVADNDPDPDARQQVRFLLDRIQRDRIPVHLNYYCFKATLKDRDEQKKLSESKPTVTDIPRSVPGGIKQAEKTIKRFFKNKLKRMKFVASSQGGLLYPLLTSFKNGFNIATGLPVLPGADGDLKINKKLKEISILSTADQFHIQEGQPISVYHNVYGFRFGVIGDGFEKTEDWISGNVTIQNRNDEKIHKLPFTVDSSCDKLVAIRDGNDVALMVLQFETEKESDAFPEDLDKKPVYHTHFNNVMGCTIHSSRQTWESGEMGKSLVDYGEAKAEIPGKNGKWKLIGYIISDSKTRRLIGRAAVLINNKGDEIAQGGQIFVPVDNPEDYEVKE